MWMKLGLLVVMLYISLRNLIGLRCCKQLCLYASYWLMENPSYVLWTDLLLKTQPAESPSRGTLFFSVCKLKAWTKACLFYDPEKGLKTLMWLWKKSLLSAYKGVLCFPVVCVASGIEVIPSFSFLSFFPIKIDSKWEAVSMWCYQFLVQFPKKYNDLW